MRRIGGQNPCRASCFASAFLKQRVEFNRPPCHASCFASVFLKKNDRVQNKTASAARILSPNPTQRPLPCLLNQAFFYVYGPRMIRVLFFRFRKSDVRVLAVFALGHPQFSNVKNVLYFGFYFIIGFFLLQN